MSFEATLILLGVLIAILPFVGIPYSWLMWFILLLGIAVAGVGTVLRAREVSERRRRVDAHPGEVRVAIDNEEAHTV